MINTIIIASQSTEKYRPGKTVHMSVSIKLLRNEKLEHTKTAVIKTTDPWIHMLDICEVQIIET